MNRTTQMPRWLPAVLWMVLIACLSTDGFSNSQSEAWLRSVAGWLHLPVTEGSLQVANFVLRKTAHFGEFFVLGVLLYWGLSAQRDGGSTVFGWILLAGVLCAVGSESIQAFTAARGPSLLDTVLDITGVLGSLGAIAGISCSQTLRRRKNTGPANAA